MSTESKLTPNAFAGLLAPVEAPALEEAVVADVDEQPIIEDTKPAPARKAPKVKKTAPVAIASETAVTPQTQPSVGDGTGSAANPYHPVNITLPLSINKRYEAYKRSTGRGPDGKPRKEHSHTEILFDAIDATIDQLPDLIRAKFGEAKATSLFNRPNRTTVTFAPEEESNTFIVRVRKDNFEILEDLWHSLGAPNRNAMIVVAYDHFLPKTSTN